MNPIRKHWRGRYALLPTLLFSVLALRVAMGFFQESISAESISIWLGFSVAVFLWQARGSARAIERFLRDTGNVLAVYTGYFVLLVLAVLTLLQIADGLAFKHESSANTMAKYSSATSLPVLQSGRVVVVEGNLDWDVLSKFNETLTLYPYLSEVHFDSNGGYVFVARAIALKILDEKLDTHVISHCYSACTIAFLAGDRRTMDHGAQLGFHQYKLESDQELGFINIADELEVDRQFFAQRGLSDAFIQQVFTADHSELWKPDMATLTDGGVLALSGALAN